MKRILLIPDKFKGSLSAKEICRIMHEELQHFDSSLKFIISPMEEMVRLTSLKVNYH